MLKKTKKKENPYHAILLDTEFSNPEFIKRWKELGRKHSRTNQWWQIKVEVPENRLEELIKNGQKLLLKKRYYFHIYRKNELIVVFPERIFYITPDKSTWNVMKTYGRTLGIPKKQLDIGTTRFEEEKY